MVAQNGSIWCSGITGRCTFYVPMQVEESRAKIKESLSTERISVGVGTPGKNRKTVCRKVSDNGPGCMLGTVGCNLFFIVVGSQWLASLSSSWNVLINVCLWHWAGLVPPVDNSYGLTTCPSWVQVPN